MQIIYEINHRFLEWLTPRRDHPERTDGLQARLSLIQEEPEKAVRMAHLAIVGSHSVNGVAALHTQILQNQVFPDFRRDLSRTHQQRHQRHHPPALAACSANPALPQLITEAIGPDWICHLDQLARTGAPSRRCRVPAPHGWRSSGRTKSAWPAISCAKSGSASIPTPCSMSRSSACTNTSVSCSTCCTSSPCTTASRTIRTWRAPREPSSSAARRPRPIIRPN